MRPAHPPPRLARVALWAPAGEKRSSLLGSVPVCLVGRVFVCFVLFLETPVKLPQPDGSNQNPTTTEKEGRKNLTEFSGQSVYGCVCERTCLSKLGDEPWALRPHRSPAPSCPAWRSAAGGSKLKCPPTHRWPPASLGLRVLPQRVPHWGRFFVFLSNVCGALTMCWVTRYISFTLFNLQNSVK